MVAALLDRGADVFAKTSTGGFLPVHVLCQGISRKLACPDRLAFLDLLTQKMMRIDALRTLAAGKSPSEMRCDTRPVRQWLESHRTTT